MFPLCSATSCHYHSQILFPGNWRGCSSLRRELIHRCSSGDNAFFGISSGTHLQKSFLTQATGSFFTTTIENKNELNKLNYMVYDMTEAVVAGDGGLRYVENATETLTEKTGSLIDSGTKSIVDISPNSSVSLADTLDLNQGSLPDAKAIFDDFSSGVKESFSSSLNQGENAVKNTLDSLSSSVTSITKNASQVVDNAFNNVFSTVDQTGDIAGDKLSSFSTGLKEASNRAAFIAIDLLRQSLSIAESSVTNGASLVVYSYGSAKELLPPDVKSALNSSEDVALKVLKPVGAVLQQVYAAIGGLERNFGLNPDDPIIHLFLFVGTTGTFWVLYRVWTYGGYAGDLSPTSTLELLTSREKSVLIDVRPEALREKDGIPDLRRAARFRYSSVTLPEVDGAVKRLLKGGSEFDDFLTAVIIKNLKAVQDRSKVIVMDADGTRSKGIARALRKVGIKNPYLVQGGFRSWVKEGLRVKELKPETTFSILNEEAEAILEELNPSPLQIVGVGVGFFAALYALSEWEATLQLIAVIGLGQTIYRRLSSYNDSEDFKQDASLLLAPVRLGAQAFSWAAGKLETNGIGLPTSPSSSDVRSRVLQAAAKHESQPSDETSEDLQDASSSSSSSPGEALNNVDAAA
ncbi:Calcium sensing receptor [Cardamine amara subsp. amara]|uniref:Calcium sensing receptor n=1 Tax=Cardamine amara subsp. amara TaxID=228776 RepID=A0ABD1A5F7_CARAN